MNCVFKLTTVALLVCLAFVGGVLAEKNCGFVRSLTDGCCKPCPCPMPHCPDPKPCPCPDDCGGCPNAGGQRP